MGVSMQRSRRRYVIMKTATPVVAISVYSAFAAQFVPAEPRLVNQDVVLAASIDTDNNAVGISDPYISAPYLQASTPAQLAAAKVKIDAEMAKMASLGVTNVRIQIDWPTVEKADGQFDWRALDQIVDSANAHNLGVLAVVSRTPSWAGGGILGNTPPDPAVYADFVGAVANRYSNRAAGTIGAYEIWNEPNGTFFYQSMDPTAYTAMLKAAYTAIKTADPQALVIAGAVGAGTTTPWGVNPVDFVKGMYDAGAKGFFDALSFHPRVPAGHDVGCPSAVPQFGEGAIVGDTRPDDLVHRPQAHLGDRVRGAHDQRHHRPEWPAAGDSGHAGGGDQVVPRRMECARLHRTDVPALADRPELGNQRS